MITLITGGERSGKSRIAQEMALDKAENPIYLATAKVMDKDFKERVMRHQGDRDDRWTNIEEPKHLSNVLPLYRTVVVDSVTLWMNNFYNHNKDNAQRALDEAKAEFDKLLNYEDNLIFVSNEIGMGLHANSKVARDFVEIHGWMNQYIAEAANHVYFVVSGIPIKVK